MTITVTVKQGAAPPPLDLSPRSLCRIVLAEVKLPNAGCYRTVQDFEGIRTASGGVYNVMKYFDTHQLTQLSIRAPRH